jgi:hypothetical protein
VLLHLFRMLFHVHLVLNNNFHDNKHIDLLFDNYIIVVFFCLVWEVESCLCAFCSLPRGGKTNAKHTKPEGKKQSICHSCMWAACLSVYSKLSVKSFAQGSAQHALSGDAQQPPAEGRHGLLIHKEGSLHLHMTWAPETILQLNLSFPTAVSNCHAGNRFPCALKPDGLG